MSKLQWKDITSYSRGDTERKPTTWEIEDGPLRVCVVWGHRDRPGQWVFHCHMMGCDTETLPGATTEAEAKAAALMVVQQRIDRFQKALNRMMSA